MDRIKKELAERKLPGFMDFNSGEGGFAGKREEKKRILRDMLYGKLPFAEYETSFREVGKDGDAYGGRAVLYHMLATVTVYGNPVSFPFRIALPKGRPDGRKEKGTFLYLGFTPVIGDGIGELVLERGYGIAHVFYQDMAADAPDHFQSGLGRAGARNPHHSAGKVALWAFGLCRVMDYLEQAQMVDCGRVTVMGHSRLGKTALMAGAFDGRFSLTAAIQSGAGGMALFRGKKGEQLKDLYREHSRDWFCPAVYEYRERIESLPFDQHFLAGLTAPRHLLIGSALRDFWADPLSEYLSCVAGTEAYRALGAGGLVRREEAEAVLFPAAEGVKDGASKDGTSKEEAWKEVREETVKGEPAGETCQWGVAGESLEGEIGWYCRYGTHYLSILDWEQVIRYRELHNV